MHTIGHMTFDQPGSAPAKIDLSDFAPSPGTGEGFFGMLDLSMDSGMITIVPQANFGLFSEKAQSFWRMHVSGLPGTGANIAREPVWLQMGQIVETKAVAGSSPREIVAMVRKAFALNMSQLAKILGVERPTVYAWAAQDDLSKIREGAKRKRLHSLVAVTKQWLERGELPPAATELPLADGKTLLDLLSAETLDAEAILQAHEQLSARQGDIYAKDKADTQQFVNAIAASLKGFGRPAGDQ